MQKHKVVATTRVQKILNIDESEVTKKDLLYLLAEMSIRSGLTLEKKRYSDGEGFTFDLYQVARDEK